MTRWADGDVLAAVVREESPRCLATLVRVLGDLDLAEDALQEALEAALRTWPRDGVPDNPGAWLTTTARHRAVDRVRRAARGRELLAMAETPPVVADAVGEEVVEVVADDQLRLVFTCCHPALAPEARIALTLRTLGGLSSSQVARAFLVAETAMQQRIVRAKRKIREAGIPYRVPEGHELPARLPPVLAVVALVHTVGLDGARHDPDAAALRREALRLARRLADLMPDEPEVLGLLALVLLNTARWPARFSPQGDVVLLADQDRTAWDAGMVAEGRALVRRCLRRDRPGPYQLQAAIQAVHSDAARATDTDWSQVLALYDQLHAVQPTPVVALNRAVALGEVHGPEAALAVLDVLTAADHGVRLDDYQPLHAVRAALLDRSGRHGEAAVAYDRASSLADVAAVRRLLRARADEARERAVEP